MTAVDSDILEALEKAAAPLRPKEIAERRNLSHSYVRKRVRKLEQDGKIEGMRGGRYSLSTMDVEVDPLQYVRRSIRKIETAAPLMGGWKAYFPVWYLPPDRPPGKSFKIGSDWGDSLPVIQMSEGDARRVFGEKMFARRTSTDAGKGGKGGGINGGSPAPVVLTSAGAIASSESAEYRRDGFDGREISSENWIFARTDGIDNQAEAHLVYRQKSGYLRTCLTGSREERAFPKAIRERRAKEEREWIREEERKYVPAVAGGETSNYLIVIGATISPPV